MKRRWREFVSLWRFAMTAPVDTGWRDTLTIFACRVGVLISLLGVFLVAASLVLLIGGRLP